MRLFNHLLANMSTSSQTAATAAAIPHLILETLLRQIPSEEFHTDFSIRACARSTTDVQRLLTLLTKMGYDVSCATTLSSENDELHCVRCHKTYLERKNGWSCCIIEHKVFIGGGERWGDIKCWKCGSCGEVGIEDASGNGVEWPGGGICYEGKHTTDRDIVRYDGDNTLSCKRKGCAGHESHNEDEDDEEDEDEEDHYDLGLLWDREFVLYVGILMRSLF
jgi:hypothetical protein